MDLMEELLGKSDEKGKEETKIIEKVDKEDKNELLDDEFDFTEDDGSGKEVYLVYGKKGEGKTYTALSFPGKIAVLSFDRKSGKIKNLLGLDNVKVWNGIKYMDFSSPEAELKSAEKNWRYLNKLLDKVIRNWEPDWIVIDGSEILSHLCELVMRYRNGIMPFQGIKNLNLWKERKQYIRQIHYLSLDIAKRGIIYTAYSEKDEIIEDGEVVSRKDVPKWLDVILYETDVVLKTYTKIVNDTIRFYLLVESSKIPEIKSGITLDITNTLPYEKIRGDFNGKGCL